jgi:hypothetical protein
MHIHLRIVRAGSLVATAAVLLAMAACAEKEATAPRSVPTEVSTDVVQDGVDLRGARAGWHATVQQADSMRRVSTTAALPVVYHGGPTMSGANKVVAIYWGQAPLYNNGPTPGTTGSGNSDFSLIGYFLRNMGGTPFWLINQQYTDAQGRGIPNSLQYTQFWANNVTPIGIWPRDSQIRQMIASGFYTKYAPSSSTIYVVFTAKWVNAGGSFGPGGYCAYHDRFSYFNGAAYMSIKYAVMPYNATYPAACTAVNAQGHTPNGDFAGDAEVNTLSHELEEAVTDPQLNAWYDNANPGQENADKCAWTFGRTYPAANGSQANVKFGSKHFLIQRNWKIGPIPWQQVGCAMN